VAGWQPLPDSQTTVSQTGPVSYAAEAMAGVGVTSVRDPAVKMHEAPPG
jgi:hypothetical protein